MKKKGFFGLCLLCTMMFSLSAFAQRRMQMTGEVMESIPGRPGWMRFVDNVYINLNGTVIRCDYGESKQATEEFFARGHVRITTKEKTVIIGETLHRPSRNGAITINQNVVVTNPDSTQLFTDRLIYDQNEEVSTYTTGGRIVSDSTVLTSKIGHHYGKTGAFHCKTDVVIVNPSYTIYTDTMQMLNDRVYFFSPTHVYSDSNYLYCENGWYKPKEKIASLTQNAFIQTKEQKMFGDSIYYEMEKDFGEAFNNVVVIDSLRDIIIHSDFAVNNKKQGDAWFTKNALGIVISDNDSLFLRGDTLRLVYDSNENIRHMLAYYNVRFFRVDMQGACDSLAYEMQDSIMAMFGNPIAWSNNDQLTGDTIRVLLADNKPKQLYLQNHAFIASKGYYEGHFNQVKGVLVEGFFNDSSELERVEATEIVETIYFVTDDTDNSLIGILKQNAEKMEVLMEKRAIANIKYFNPEPGNMHPEVELPKEERFLKGFLWQEERRPKSKSDISNLP